MTNWSREWDHYEKVDAITNDINRAIERAIEYDVSVETIIGVLESLKLEYWLDHNVTFESEDIETDDNEI